MSEPNKKLHELLDKFKEEANIKEYSTTWCINQQLELSIYGVKIPILFKFTDAKPKKIKLYLSPFYIYNPGDTKEYYELIINNGVDYVRQIISTEGIKYRQNIVDGIRVLNNEIQTENFKMNYKLNKENLEEQYRRKRLQISYTSEDYQRQITHQNKQWGLNIAKIVLGVVLTVAGAAATIATAGAATAAIVPGLLTAGGAIGAGISGAAGILNNNESLENLRIQQERHNKNALQDANLDCLQANIKLDIDYSNNISLMKNDLMGIMNNWETPIIGSENLNRRYEELKGITPIYILEKTTNKGVNKNICEKILNSYGVTTKFYGFTITNQEFLKDGIYVFSNVDVIEGINNPIYLEILKKRLINGIKIIDVNSYSFRNPKTNTEVN